MGAPKSAKATCRHCSEKIVFVLLRLSDDEIKENEEAVAKGGYPPNTVARQKHWFHSERAWERDRFCPSTLKEVTNTTWAGKEYTSLVGSKAAPKEFCQEQLKDKWEACHKPVIPDSGEHLMCGIHWAMMRREIEDRERREQEEEIRAWARENRLKKEEAERKEREEREEEERKVLQKKLDVLTDQHLDFTIVEPPRRRSWEPAPNPPPPTRVTVDLDALVAILDKER